MTLPNGVVCEQTGSYGVLATEETLQRIYETISNKPEKMVKYENAPRPDVERE